MQVSQNSVVQLELTLMTQDGQMIQPNQPLAFIFGVQQVFPPRVEAGMAGKGAGELVTVDVAPEEAFGARNEEMVQKVPRGAFQGVEKIEPGMQFQAKGPQGQMAMVMVVAVDEEFVTVDSNHPLAGVPLRFVIKIVDVREATAEELSHGHAHGVGGAQHGHEHGHGEAGGEQQPPQPPQPPRESRQRR